MRRAILIPVAIVLSLMHHIIILDFLGLNVIKLFICLKSENSFYCSLLTEMSPMAGPSGGSLCLLRTREAMGSWATRMSRSTSRISMIMLHSFLKVNKHLDFKLN